MKRRRCLIIGLDGATWDLILPWAKKGELPAFLKLVKHGAWGELESTIPPMTPSAWVSISTGKNPGKHGIYSFLKIDENYNFDLVTSTDVKSKNIWEYCTKSIVINFPISYPPQKINGYMVAGMLTPGTESDFTYPRELKKMILHKIPNYRLELQWELYEGKEAEFLRDLYQMTEGRITLIKEMLKKEWQLFFSVLIGPDRIQHLFWSEENLLSYYKKIDNFLSDILAALDKNTTLVVISDHGFQKIDKVFYCNTWLMKEGYLKTKETSLTNLLKKFGLTSESIIRLLRLMKVDVTTLGRKLPYKLRKLIPLEGVSIYQSVDWSKTRAFMVEFGQIFINKKGKFLRGTVGPKEYEKIRSELAQKLMKIRDPRTGDLIVSAVYKREEIYRGDYLENAPDLVFELKEGCTHSARIEKNYIEDSAKMRADHAKNGIIAFLGSNVKKGFEIKEAKTVDVAPTVLYALGLPIPDDMDGRVMKEVFKDNIEVGGRRRRNEIAK